MNCSLWNVHSMINKTPAIMEHIQDHNPSIVFLTETWLKSDVSDVTALVKTYGYRLVHNRRKNREKETGGGVGVLLKTGMKYKHMSRKSYSSFELTVVKVFQNRGKSLLLVCIYRLLFVSAATFLDEISNLFEWLATSSEIVLIAGDINLHMEENELYSQQFRDMLSSFNLIQHVDFPTHRDGHTLDIVASFEDDISLSSFTANQNDVSDHSLVTFDMQFFPNVKEEKEIIYRDIKNINVEEFEADIDGIELSESLSFGDNISLYNDALSDVLNKHAPVKKKTIKCLPESPWFDGEYISLRRERRKAEVRYKKTGISVHKEEYINLRTQCTNLAHKKKCEYYADKLNTTDGKILYSQINKLVDKKQESVLPESKSDGDLANSFLNFFTEKIKKIRATFPEKRTDYVIPSCNNHISKLSVFESVTQDELRKIVSSFGVKCSPDDPIPAKLLTKYIDKFLPMWELLVNISLSQGSMECLKNAVIAPLIKEMDGIMDKDIFKNYRPVSNLLFVGKLIERVVSTRLNNHMTKNNLHSNSNHGYKKFHSSETLLLEVVNELLLSCDNGKPSIVLLLDLSAAFDTVDQKKLLNILQYEIGVEGIALQWFESFLCNRTQKVKIGESYSEEGSLDFGVAQGSVLGPDLFKIYIRMFPEHMKTTLFQTFGFADDHQLVKTFLPVLQVYALGEDIQNCFDEIAKWMNEYFLRLNAGKTKILIILPPSLRNTIVIRGTFINGDCIRFAHSAKNLGVILDDELSFEKQILKVVKSCFFSIRTLSRIKCFLTELQLRTAICAFVFSRLDYCNVLYYNIKCHLLKKLQSVQNSAARLLQRKSGNVGVPLDVYMRTCHWLCVRDRITFKICLFVFKSLCGFAPVAMQEMCSFNTSERTVMLDQPPFKTDFGKRAFSRVAPRMWNLLPKWVREKTDLNAFKTALKTYLFDSGAQLIAKLYES